MYITPSPDYNTYLARAIKISIWLQKCPRICGQPAKKHCKKQANDEIDAFGTSLLSSLERAGCM